MNETENDFLAFPSVYKSHSFLKVSLLKHIVGGLKIGIFFDVSTQPTFHIDLDALSGRLESFR